MHACMQEEAFKAAQEPEVEVDTAAAVDSRAIGVENGNEAAAAGGSSTPTSPTENLGALLQVPLNHPYTLCYRHHRKCMQ